MFYKQIYAINKVKFVLFISKKVFASTECFCENSSEESFNDVIKLGSFGRERVYIDVFLEKISDKVGDRTGSYQVKEFYYYP